MAKWLTPTRDLREGRAQLLGQAKQQGYLTGYEGIRISKTGRRFRICEAVIWQVFDETGQVRGQAAAFNRWVPL